MTTFERARLDQLPDYLGGVEGEALASGLGQAQDAELPLLRAAAVSDLPELAPDDALEGSRTVGDWYAIERYPSESTATFRARVSAAFDVWAKAGSAVAIEEQIQAYGIPDVRVYTAGHDGFRANSGDSHAHFWIVLGPDYGTTGIEPMVLGSWTLGTGTLGTTATRAQIVAVKRIILKWKSAHSYPVRVLCLFDTAPHLGISTTLGTWTLGGGSNPITWPMGRVLTDTITTLGFKLGGFEV